MIRTLGSWGTGEVFRLPAGCAFVFLPLPERFHIIPPLVCGEIEEMMAAQAEQDFRHVFSCVSDIRLLIRAGDQVADEFFLFCGCKGSETFGLCKRFGDKKR